MKTYYRGKRAAFYNQTWKTFSARTLTETCAIIDLTQLQKALSVQKHVPRILDAACGTGLLLQRLGQLIPDAALYGGDESQDMLAQAHLLLQGDPRIHLTRAELTSEKLAGLPYEAAFFDVITCTNTFHYLDNPVAVIRGLAALLSPQGQLIIEDYARRAFPFPWRAFEWFIKRIDPQHMQAYTLTEAQALCQAAGLQITATKNFSIDRLWKGWVLRGIVNA